MGLAINDFTFFYLVRWRFVEQKTGTYVYRIYHVFLFEVHRYIGMVYRKRPFIHRRLPPFFRHRLSPPVFFANPFFSVSRKTCSFFVFEFCSFVSRPGCRLVKNVGRVCYVCGGVLSRGCFKTQFKRRKKKLPPDILVSFALS